jgi:hypothetical protein
VSVLTQKIELILCLLFNSHILVYIHFFYIYIFIYIYIPNLCEWFYDLP